LFFQDLRKSPHPYYSTRVVGVKGRRPIKERKKKLRMNDKGKRTAGLLRSVSPG
jgi:hypothetical protein